MISFGVSLLYVSFYLVLKNSDCFLLKMSVLVEKIMKKFVFEYQKDIILDVVVVDVNDEDVDDLFYVKIKFYC